MKKKYRNRPDLAPKPPVIEGRRFNSLEDYENNRGIEKFLTVGAVTKLNPEWVNAPYGETLIWGKTITRKT